MKKLKSTFVNMVVVLTFVAAFAALLVSFVYQKTGPRIMQNELENELSAIDYIFGSEYNNNPLEEKTLIAMQNGDKSLEMYPLRKDGSIYALAIKSYTQKGFGGDMHLMVGFYLDGTMAGYNVLKHQETPGLGTKVTERKFKKQFDGLLWREGLLKLKKDGGEIDGVTSATISSRAVLDALNRAKQAYDKFTSGVRE